MTYWKSLGAFALLLIIGGCASLPDVTVTYYHAKWESQVTFTQTVACNTDQTRLYWRTIPSVSTTYSSDLARPFELKLPELRGQFVDSDVTVNLTEDGRLKSINQSATGQGEAIVKAFVAMTAAISPVKMWNLEAIPEPVIPECATIEKYGDKKAITLVYKINIGPSNLGAGPAEVDAASESKDLYEKVKGALPTIKVSVGGEQKNESGPKYTSAKTSNVVMIEVTNMSAAELRFTETPKVKPVEAEIGKARIYFPSGCPGAADRPCVRKVAIPKPALFGKEAFSVQLAESGAITSIGYTATSGVAGAMNAITALANADSPATKAAELKAQADLIAQEQRLVQCQAKPDTCK